MYIGEEDSMTVRFAEEQELDLINELRRQVNALHTEGRPDMFRPGFGKDIQDYLRAIWDDPEQEIVVAESNGKVTGYAVLHHIRKPQNPFMYERDNLGIDEFGVDCGHRRQGIGSAMMAFIREYARGKGFQRIELNMWEFNQDALAFYEAAGFETYRRYMEAEV